jgi:hypothetical protein
MDKVEPRWCGHLGHIGLALEHIVTVAATRVTCARRDRRQGRCTRPRDWGIRRVRPDIAPTWCCPPWARFITTASMLTPLHSTGQMRKMDGPTQWTRNAECRRALPPFHASSQKEHIEISLMFWRLPVCASGFQPLVRLGSVRLGSVQLGQEQHKMRVCRAVTGQSWMGPHGRGGLSECQRFFLGMAHKTLAQDPEDLITGTMSTKRGLSNSMSKSTDSTVCRPTGALCNRWGWEGLGGPPGHIRRAHLVLFTRGERHDSRREPYARAAGLLGRVS